MKLAIKRLVRRLGFDIIRFNPSISEATRLHRLLEQLEVDLILDVGANRGQYGRRVRQGGYRGMIVSFEPQARAHAELNDTARRDSKWVVGPRAALGCEEGEAKLYCSANSVSSSLLPMLDPHLRASRDSKLHTIETVPVHRLDHMAPSYVAGRRSPFLKLDVQGYEKRVLDGAAVLLPALSGLQVELALEPLFEGQLLLPEMVVHLRNQGFLVYGFLHGFTDVSTGRQLQVDGLFARADLLS